MPHSETARIDTAILQAVAYADVFDYPLTAPQVHRYLTGVRASPDSVQSALSDGQLVPHHLRRHQEYYFLPGRDEIVETRRRRAAVAARMWPKAWRYGLAIARLPFVRMVAVTGALAVDNVEAGTDIDYFVVTEPGRLWLCRAMVVGLVHLAARRGDVVCPNYFLSERSLRLDSPSLYTAHELAQMVTVWGHATYRQMCLLNSWAARYLPNAFDGTEPVDLARHSGAPEAPDGIPGRWRYPRLLAEAALRTPAGAWLEGWEMRRKVRKLGAQARAAAMREEAIEVVRARLSAGIPSRPPRNGTLRAALLPLVEAAGQARDAEGDAVAAREVEIEAAFGADRCKGHLDRHGQRTMRAFAERMHALALTHPQVAETARALECDMAGGSV